LRYCTSLKLCEKGLLVNTKKASKYYLAGFSTIFNSRLVGCRCWHNNGLGFCWCNHWWSCGVATSCDNTATAVLDSVNQVPDWTVAAVRLTGGGRLTDYNRSDDTASNRRLATANFATTCLCARCGESDCCDGEDAQNE